MNAQTNENMQISIVCHQFFQKQNKKQKEIERGQILFQSLKIVGVHFNESTSMNLINSFELLTTNSTLRSSEHIAHQC